MRRNKERCCSGGHRGDQQTSDIYTEEVTEITSSHEDDPELPEETKVALGTINLYWTN